MTLTQPLRLTLLVIANALLPISVLVFALGFFPYKPLLPGLATARDARDTELWGEEQPDAVFDKVVFLVIDALRTDFVYGYHSGFQFTQSLIRDGAAIPFTAHAAPPTVTMPRVKALTTGSVPSFADLIFNLDESGAGSTLATQDTWLAQIRTRGGKLVFYGDDTWLRLFPNDFFTRADGTSSFFVSDFTEVDLNVTRHVPRELAEEDWDAMVMHYLGLDHIGHKTGPSGPNMLPKQREMDGLVKTIYEAMEEMPHHRRTLLVLAGDHGMNAGGNHGGSGPGETEPALLFLSPWFKSMRDRTLYECPTSPKAGTEFHYYQKVEQSDLVPTLAALMGLPIPKNSLGVFVNQMAGLWASSKQVTQLLYRNARQIRSIIDAAYGAESFQSKVAGWTRELQKKGTQAEAKGDEDELALSWALAQYSVEAALAGSESWESAHSACQGFLLKAQETLSNAASAYNISRMLTGMFISAVSGVVIGMAFPSLWSLDTANVFFALTTRLYGLILFGSSFVEEEQHLWYWLTPAWFTLLSMTSIIQTRDPRSKGRLALAGLTILAVHRLAIRWNQTGQKHAGGPDIVHTFFPQHHTIMWILVLATYGYTGLSLAQRALVDLVAPELAALIATALVLPALVFKLNFTQADAPELVQGLALPLRTWTAGVSLVAQAQVAFALQALVTVSIIVLAVGLARGTAIGREQGPAVRVTLAERLHYLSALFLITQSRAPNIPLFLGLEAQRAALRYLLHTPQKDDSRASSRRSATISSTALATSVLLLSHTYFFCMGGSNSISSVDLSNAYNGVGNYNPVFVGFLLFASNWTGPIWWCSAAVTMTFSKPRKPATPVSLAPKDRRWVDEERSRLHEDAISEPHSPAQRKAAEELWLAYVSVMTAFVSAGLFAVMAACTLLRTHLFIWTVFSPKYLYAAAWCVGWHLLVSIGYGSSLRWLGCVG